MPNILQSLTYVDSRMLVALMGVGIFFMEDALLAIICHSADFVRIFQAVTTKRRRGPSIVRLIGSRLTWIRAPRFNIICQETFSDTCSFAHYETMSISSSAEDDVPNERCKELEAKVDDLEKEMLNLRNTVSQMISMQEKNVLYASNSTPIDSSSPNIQPPTPPPPPPPPLPRSPLMKPSKNIIVKVKAKNMIVQAPPCSIVEELSKRPPKLRHVELASGGRPVRTTQTHGPEDCLIKILRKRFEAIHSPKHSLPSLD